MQVSLCLAIPRCSQWQGLFKKTRSSTEDNDGWYMLHGGITVRPAIYYFVQLRAWLDLHPNEVVVVWLTRHGNSGETGLTRDFPNRTTTDIETWLLCLHVYAADLPILAEYPAASVQAKQAFWAKLASLFKGMLFDTKNGTRSLKDTPMSTLIATGQRLVIYAADWKEFTDSSSFAIDAKGAVDNAPPGPAESTYDPKGTEEGGKAKKGGRMQKLLEQMASSHWTDKFKLVSSASNTQHPQHFWLPTHLCLPPPSS